jgi:hypothetical protein
MHYGILFLFFSGFLLAQPIPIPNQYVYPGIPFDNNQRLASNPYITGDTIRAHCDWVIDETVTAFDPSLVCHGDAIFLNANWCSFFFEKIHPAIQANYILVTHNSVFHAPGVYAPYLNDSKLVAWFAKNTMIEHPKMYPLPLGIANKYWPHGNTDMIDTLRAQLPNIKKDILLYVNFDINTNPTRLAIYTYFAAQPFSHIAKAKSFDAYLLDLARSQFVISPPGSSLDCHRIWEALLVNCIPIVMHSPLDFLLHDLPVLLIDDWQDVTESFLRTRYKQMKPVKYARKKLFAAYWIRQIDAVKARIKESL